MSIKLRDYLSSVKDSKLVSGGVLLETSKIDNRCPSGAGRQTTSVEESFGFAPDNGQPLELTASDFVDHIRTFGHVGWRPFRRVEWVFGNGSRRDEIQARWDQRKLDRGTAKAKAGSRKTGRL